VSEVGIIVGYVC